MVVRILSIDYVKSGKVLTICIADNINGSIKIVHTDNIFNKSEKQAIELCKQFYKKFDCDKIISEDLEISF